MKDAKIEEVGDGSVARRRFQGEEGASYSLMPV